tara:strand:+ start:1638 stop:2108 length:471 start_codon:yes stop_codon:yes gene_type:complete
MKLSALKTILQELDNIEFILPNGDKVPEHFHVTEIGKIEKKFVDCGGTLRNETIINFQLWTANDYDHRLSAQKLKSIVELSEKELLLDDLEIEVEYQSDTIGKYDLDHSDGKFILRNTTTECLGGDSCLIPNEKTHINIANIGNSQSSCSPESGCC